MPFNSFVVTLFTTFCVAKQVTTTKTIRDGPQIGVCTHYELAVSPTRHFRQTVFLGIFGSR